MGVCIWKEYGSRIHIFPKWESWNRRIDTALRVSFSLHPPWLAGSPCIGFIFSKPLSPNSLVMGSHNCLHSVLKSSEASCCNCKMIFKRQRIWGVLVFLFLMQVSVIFLSEGNQTMEAAKCLWQKSLALRFGSCVGGFLVIYNCLLLAGDLIFFFLPYNYLLYSYSVESMKLIFLRVFICLVSSFLSPAKQSEQ